MKKLHSSNRLVDISEPILAEDSTSSVIALSLSTILEQLDKDATHHDYLVALLLVFLAESGFRIAFVSNTSEWNQNTRLVCIPTNWKSQETGVYEIRLILHNIENFPLKLIVLPYGDKLLLNMIPYVEGKTVYSMIIQTLNYVNPYTNNLCFRYMNLKKISHRYEEMIFIFFFLK
ncbi:uncharacterized protein LOC105427828 [Pogonomyrmex barbatus]|uniref:Uncharacterized protein LOC105427828 n=1 Tax=Pogonomyrmex barbatus TaxID=144034 RepID=A0A6I9W8G3_9HYME|nr:uncharacterized protein LOC105427828 [Pogonomyrmex barbatus]